jgi:sulfite reductase beta subunit-like hemoprotein
MTEDQWVADRCPGVLRLHEAADGWMARVRLPGGRLSPEALEIIGDVAALGSGLVELTSRASVQIRGLAIGSGDAVATRLETAGLMPSVRHDRVRNILASPVAGRHPDSLAGADEVVAELDRGLCADLGLAELPGRFLFAVVDGSGTLGPHRADVSLEAAQLGGGVVFRLHLSGVPTTLTATMANAAGLALEAARGFLELASADGVHVWGLSGLREGPQRLASRLGGDLAPDHAPSIGAPLQVGTLTQSNGRATVTVMPPLGRLHGLTLRKLAQCSRRRRCVVRISPRRTVSLIDLELPAAPTVTSELSSLELVTSSRSGWNGLSACAGKGACAKALVDVRRAAEQRAGVRDGGSPAEHWSGCERRCGEPPGAGIRFVAGPRAPA